MLAQAVWYLKCRALTLKNWLDDTEIEEEVRKSLFFCPSQLRHNNVLFCKTRQGIADILLDEHQTAQVARPGTSLSRPMTSAQGGAVSALACVHV